MSNIKNDDRAILDMFKNEVVSRIKPDANLNEHDLILIQKLEANNATVTFEVGGNDSNKRETPLQKGDIFCLAHGLLGIRKMRSKDGKNFVPASDIVTFADPRIFDNAKDGLNEIDAIKAIYNGLMSIETSVMNRFKNFSTRNFLNVPTSENAVNAYGRDHCGRGFYPFAQFSVLCGGSDNKITVKLSDAGREMIGGEVFSSDGTMLLEYNELVFIAKGFVARDTADLYQKTFK